MEPEQEGILEYELQLKVQNKFDDEPEERYERKVSNCNKIEICDLT